MAEDNKGAPKDVSDSKTDHGSIPARLSSSGPQSPQALEREGGSKDKTDSGRAPADARKPGSSDPAPATNKSYQQEIVSSSTPGVSSPTSTTQAKTISSPYYEFGTNSARSPESPNGISETERRLAELTVLRGRKMPLDQSELPLSPMLQRGPPASKGRRVSIDMQPTIGLISPRSALRSPDTGVSSPSEEAPTTPPTDPANPLLTAVANEDERKPSASSIRSSLSSRRKTSTDSQKRAVVYPPVLKVRGSSTSTGTEGATEPGPSAPPDQTHPEVGLPGEQRGNLVGIPDFMVSPQMADLTAFYNNLMSRGRLGSLGRPSSSRRDSSQRYRRPSSSLPGKSGSRGSLQGQQVPPEQLSVSVGKRTIFKRWLACVVCICVLLLAPLTMLLAKHFMEPPFASGRGVCDSDDCVLHARQILRTLNTSADPCLGFYAYVCGSGAGSENGGEAQSDDSSRKTGEGIGSLDEIDPAWRLARLYAYQVNNVLGNLPQLLTVIKTSDTTLKAFTALSLCLQREVQHHSRSFATFMKDRNLPWPLHPSRSVRLLDVVDVLLDLSINWRASIWIDVRLWHLKTQTFSGPVVVFDEPGHVPIIRMEQISTANDIEYAIAVERMAQFIVGSKKSSGTTTRGASLISAVEIEQLKRDETYVREAVLPTERREDAYDTLVPLHMMRLTTNFTMEIWVDLFRKYFKPAGLNVTIDTALLILNNQHFKALTKLMSNMPASRLLSALGWMFAYSYSWIANAEFDFFSNQGGATSGGPSEHGLFAHVLCFVAVHESFGISLEAAMFLHQLPSDERLKVTKIVNATARSLIEAVRASRGVSNTTKADAEAKISSALLRELWPPQPFLNPDRLDALYSGFPSVRASDFYASWLESRIALRASLPNRFHGTLMTAKLRGYEQEILYIYSLNIMLLDLASVFPPMYLKDGNSVMALAGLGFQLLRQLVKSVDERGRQLDYATGKKISWWEENRVCKIKKATSTKERREIKDLFALQLALAIAEKLAEADGPPLRLKFLENLSPVQTFYVSYCSHFCGERGDQEMCDLAMKTSEFVEAFACLWRGADLGYLFV